MLGGGPRHCLIRRALENKLRNPNCWSWYHCSQEKLTHTLIPVIASTLLLKVCRSVFMCHPVYSGGKYAVPFLCATLYIAEESVHLRWLGFYSSPTQVWPWPCLWAVIQCIQVIQCIDRASRKVLEQFKHYGRKEQFAKETSYFHNLIIDNEERPEGELHWASKHTHLYTSNWT